MTTLYFPMKKLQFYFVWIVVLLATYLNATTLEGKATTSMSEEAPVCSGAINLSLDENCQASLTPDLLLEAPDPLENYQIFITDPPDSTGNYSRNGTDSVIILNTGTYQYSVVDMAGNTCWGTLNAEDKLPPVFATFVRDTLIRCSVDLTESGIGATRPTATDLCGGATVTFLSAFVEQNAFPCDTSIVASLWQATDIFGNSVIDTQRTVFIRPDMSKLLFPEDITLSCGVDTEADLDNLTKTGAISVQVGKISNGIFVPSDTLSLNETSGHCSFALTKTDSRTSNDCEVSIVRYWDIVDWCAPVPIPIRVDTQLVRLSDTIAPIFAAHPNGNLLNPLRAELGTNCLFVVEPIAPAATDNCDTLPTVEMFEVAQLVNGTYVKIGTNTSTTALPSDTLRLGYRAFDRCYNQTKEDTIYTFLITEDRTAPAVICADNLVIAVANNIGSTLRAETVDGGSFDACGAITKEIRRKDVDTTWQSAILLPCELIDSQIVIELRITDMAGNENFCETTVRLEDKVSPVCQNLGSQTVTCDVIRSNDFGVITDANHNDAFDEAEWRNMTANQALNYNETFGDPACRENIDCKSFTIEQQYQRVENACGIAQVKRRFRGVDSQGNIGAWAEQSITATYQAGWSITFAPDWEGGCNDTIPEPFIEVQNGACDILSVNVTEKTFTADEDFCLKVERTYQVINSCLFSATSTPFTVVRPANVSGTVTDTFIVSADSLAGQAHLIYRQILKIRSTDRPNLSLGAVDLCLRGAGLDTIPPKQDSLGCAELRTFTASATDCIGNAVTRFQWNFYENDVLQDSGTGNSFSKAVLPAIDYSVQFTAFDACNNQVTERQDYVFQDCTKPTIFGRTGITIELINGSAEIWASDFDKGSSDNCTDQATLLDNFRIWHTQLGDAPTTVEEIKNLPTNITFTCAHLASQEVFIYTFDAADNIDRIEAFVLVQDNQESCVGQNRINVGGQIFTENGVEIEDVSVALSGGMTTNKVTGASGNYVFDLPMGRDYMIQPTKTMNPLNGVTTFDLIVISKHILGIDKLDSPYQHIAADVNKSGSITAFDLVQLRQLILENITELPNNDSWRFVDSNYRFTTKVPENEPFLEQVLFDEMEKELMDVNFIGVKIGDVNGSVAANRLSGVAESRNKKRFHFTFEDQLLKQGERVTIPFMIDGLPSIEGVQFALDFKNLDLVEVGEGLAKANNINLNLLAKGRLATSWNRTAEIEEEQPLFILTFEAKQNDLLSNLLSIDEERMTAEAYTTEYEQLAVSLTFENAAQAGMFELFQNKPNPFSQETSIPFYLPKGENVRLQIMDMQGRVLQVVDRSYEKGFHEINIDKRSLSAVGVLYYQLTVGTNIATRKMVVIE